MAKQDTTENKTDQSIAIPFMLGEKRGMTQVFTEDGTVHPATIVEVGPMTVVQVKTLERDGYRAYQLGYGQRRKKNVSKAQRGHTKEARNESSSDNEYDFTVLREYRVGDDVELESEIQPGYTFDASVFSVGDKVNVAGVSKGKGFQGVVKRHGFSGGPKTHGTKHTHRAAGSIGATGPSHVFKGMKMPGRMGGERKTVKNLEIVHVDTEDNKLYIRGGLPGPTGALLEVEGQTNSSDNSTS